MHFTKITINDVSATFDEFNRTRSADCFFCNTAGTATAIVTRKTIDGHTLSDYACSFCKAQWEKGKEQLESYLLDTQGYVEITQHTLFNPDGFYEGLESVNRNYGKVIPLTDRDLYDREYERRLYAQEIEAVSSKI